MCCSEVDDYICKADEWLSAEDVHAALRELSRAVAVTESAVHSGGEASTLRLLQLVTMLHRCRATPGCSEEHVRSAHDLTSRVLHASRCVPGVP